MLRNYLTLFKVYLSLAIALSTVAGFILYSGSISPPLWFTALGVFLLSCSAAALNQVQERHYDALMERTRNRPIPMGRITPFTTLAFATGLLVAGAVLLFSAGTLGAALLGVGNLAWYNAVYTPLKRKSYFAVLAGALNGAVPPLIGWVAAGGLLTAPRILFITFFIFTWQVPHFWMLLLMHGKDYQKAGFYSVTERFPPRMMTYLLFLWIVATAVVTMFLPWFGILAHKTVTRVLAILVLAMIAWFAWALLFRAKPVNQKLAFITFNLFMVVVFGMVIVDQLARW